MRDTNLFLFKFEFVARAANHSIWFKWICCSLHSHPLKKISGNNPLEVAVKDNKNPIFINYDSIRHVHTLNGTKQTASPFDFGATATHSSVFINLNDVDFYISVHQFNIPHEQLKMRIFPGLFVANQTSEFMLELECAVRQRHVQNSNQ